MASDDLPRSVLEYQDRIRDQIDRAIDLPGKVNALSDAEARQVPEPAREGVLLATGLALTLNKALNELEDQADRISDAEEVLGVLWHRKHGIEDPVALKALEDFMEDGGDDAGD